MIRIITSKRLSELEFKERRYDEALLECNVGVGRWCTEFPFVNEVIDRIRAALLGNGLADISDFRDGLRQRVALTDRAFDRLRAAAGQQSRAICESLGTALYGPMLVGEASPFWAMETPEALAKQAAERIGDLTGKVAHLESTLDTVQRVRAQEAHTVEAISQIVRDKDAARKLLDEIAGILHAHPVAVPQILKSYLRVCGCNSGGGCAGNGLCCWYWHNTPNDGLPVDESGATIYPKTEIERTRETVSDLQIVVARVREAANRELTEASNEWPEHVAQQVLDLLDGKVPDGSV